jgi:hypothetical protein
MGRDGPRDALSKGRLIPEKSTGVKNIGTLRHAILLCVIPSVLFLLFIIHLYLIPLCLIPLCLTPLCLIPLCLIPLCLITLCLIPLCPITL